MSADEIDAELLAMAGDSSDDDGDDFDQTQAIEEPSSEAEPQPSVERPVEAPARTKGVAQKVKSRGRKKRKHDSDDDDLDILSPSPARSPESGIVNESDADASGELDNEATPYPLDGKFKDARDRETIMAMNEVDREEILAERANEEIRRRQDSTLKKALAATASANKQKRKAVTADLDDGAERNTRPKTNKRSALDEYRRAREQKGAERGRLDSRHQDRDARSPSKHSDHDADGESEVEWAEPASNPRRDEPPAELRDFELCRVGRSNFAAVCFYPGFEDAIRGCFCRVNIGVNRETGKPLYRMTQIKDFTEGKPYQLEGAYGRKFTMDQYALVAQGDAEKPFPLSACSDGRFANEEFARFTEALRKASVRIPSRKFLKQKLDSINGLVNTNFTEETLQQKFNKQTAMAAKHDPALQNRLKRQAIEKRRVAALDRGNLEEAERCDAEFAEFMSTAPVLAGVYAKPTPVSNSSNLDRLAKLNHKNRGKTTQEVRKALIEERRKLLREREENARIKKEAEEAVSTAAQKQAPEGSTPETATPKRTGTPLNGAKSGPLGALKRKNLDDDVIGSLDLGIDIEI